MVDFNGDGLTDIISGSYSPGHLFLFARQKDQSFAAGEKILDRNEKPILVGSAAHAFAADWDGDNDLDLVVGNIQGEVFLVPNEGKPGAYAFGKPERLQAPGGSATRSIYGENAALDSPAEGVLSFAGTLLAAAFKPAKKEKPEGADQEKKPEPAAEPEKKESELQPIKVGHGDAGPVVADWNADGLPDLIVGGGDGSVVLFRNIGTRTKPQLGRAEFLVPPQVAEWGEKPEACGRRTKVCVTDFNGDGQVDLLVGDFASFKAPEPELTDEQKAERKAAKAEYQKVTRAYSKAMNKPAIKEAQQAYIKLIRQAQESGEDANKLSDEKRKKLEADTEAAMQAYSNIIEADEELKKLTEQMEELRPKMGGSAYETHGFVWFLARQKPAEITAANP